MLLLQEREEKPLFENIFKEIKNRDHMDMNRKVAPLTRAKDAIAIDTTGLSIPQTCDVMLKEISKIQ